jgi:hypothetical protein
MLDQLFKIIQDSSVDTVVNNKQIPNEHNEGVQKVVLSEIQNGLSSAIAGGNISGVMDLFGKAAKGGQLTNNPIVSLITNNVTSALKSKFGISEAISKSMVNSLIPVVLSKFSQKTADKNDASIDMNTVIKSLAGGKLSNGLDFNSLLNQVTQKGSVGGIDFGNMASALLGGDQKKKSSNQDVAGGLLNALGGFLKK